MPVIYGSVRSERQGIRAARYVLRRLDALGVDGVLVDPMENKLPLLDKMYKEYDAGTAPPELEKLADLYRKADGFIVVCGEYNHAIPPAMSNQLDYFLEEFFWRPCGIVSYSGGRFSGVRASMMLRAMLSELGMVTLPSDMPIARVQDAFDDQGLPADPQMDARNETFFAELMWYMTALRNQRAQGTPY